MWVCNKFQAYKTRISKFLYSILRGTIGQVDRDSLEIMKRGLDLLLSLQYVDHDVLPAPAAHMAF
jgi:hypothetical protein